MRNLLIDTGFWFALFDKSDQYHRKALEISEYLDSSGNRIIIPFPTLYETMNTKFVDNKIVMNQFEVFLTKSHVIKYPDEDYRENAIKITFETKRKQNRNLSLTDNLIRLIIEDSRNKIDILVTFNEKDFSDICRKRNVLININ